MLDFFYNLNILFFDALMFLNPEKSLNLFSSKGKLTQCDNALTASMNSALSIGCASDDGVVLVSVKHLSSLLVKSQYHKVFSVCPTIGVTYSGLQPDFRAQLDVAQKICQDYYDIYEKYPTLDVFINEFCLSVQEYSQKGGFRPFGTFLIFCGETKNGPCCCQMDCSGSFKEASVVTSGKGFEDAKKFLERRREKLDDNIVNSIFALRDFNGREMTSSDVSIGVFRLSTHSFTVYNEEQVQEVFDSIKN